jgi:hypothetical protein
MRNDIYNDFCRNPWKTEKPAPAGSSGYCGPDNVETATEEEDQDNE